MKVLAFLMCLIGSSLAAPVSPCFSVQDSITKSKFHTFLTSSSYFAHFRPLAVKAVR